MSVEADDEDDYMSDALLQQCQDVRPGLLSKTAGRNLEIAKRQKEEDQKSKIKPIAVQAQEKREEGLANAIKSDNKGFALLQKMGYKAGMGIGKEGNKGRVEPVPVEVKLGRGGLGKDSDVKRKREFREAFNKQLQVHKTKKMNEMQNDFRQRLAKGQNDKRVMIDLSKSQKVCEELDIKKGNLSKPEEPFFWPERLCPYNEEEEEEEEGYEEEDEEAEELDVSEKLDILTDYLRTTYHYCVWCGATYSDREDMESNCPGDTAEDHGE